VLRCWPDVTAQSGGEDGGQPDTEALRRELAAAREDLARCREEQHELDEFISLLAHDLRTPLTSIRGYAQLLQRHRAGPAGTSGAAGAARAGVAGATGGADPVASGLQIIVDQSDRLSAMTNLLLDVSRIRLSRVAVIPARVDLAAALRLALASWPAQRVAPRLELAEPALHVTADAKRVPQLVGTLLDYFAHRTADDVPVACRVARDRGGDGDGARAALVVEDEGDPLAPHELERLFDRLLEDPSMTAERRLARAELYILRGVAQAHGGGVSADSPVPGTGRGVRLTLHLPLAGRADAA
jgi:signal transduction histidine kinase